MSRIPLRILRNLARREPVQKGGLMRKALIAIGVAAALALVPAAAALAQGAGGVSAGPAILVNGTAYRTVGTPTDLSGTGGPASSFDTIYDFGGSQLNVATAAPGDPGYNGGRWRVHGLSFNTSYATTLAAYDLNADALIDTNTELEAMLADTGPAGATDVGVVKSFECPVISLH
jgi:hypothetical protein